MADVQLYRGPNGLVFAPAEAVHADTVEQMVERGEWEPVEAPKPARASRQKSEK